MYPTNFTNYAVLGINFRDPCYQFLPISATTGPRATNTESRNLQITAKCNLYNSSRPTCACERNENDILFERIIVNYLYILL